MPTPQQRICQLADEAAAEKEPEAALRKIRELRDELDAFERARVGDALRTGSSFSGVARALGVSRQAAHRRYRDLPNARSQPLPLSSHARHAVHLAREEASVAGARHVGSAHLLIGVLRSGGSTSRALEATGVTADAARMCARAAETAVDGEHVNADGAVRAVLQQASEIARARHARYVEADHIVLAALSGADGDAPRAITALGVTPGAVRRRLTY
jgi:Clp amino terminal domain, pathogenicity island component